jgi:hypothetical protein
MVFPDAGGYSGTLSFRGDRQGNPSGLRGILPGLGNYRRPDRPEPSADAGLASVEPPTSVKARGHPVWGNSKTDVAVAAEKTRRLRFPAVPAAVQSIPISPKRRHRQAQSLLLHPSVVHAIQLILEAAEGQAGIHAGIDDGDPTESTFGFPVSFCMAPATGCSGGASYTTQATPRTETSHIPRSA